MAYSRSIGALAGLLEIGRWNGLMWWVEIGRRKLGDRGEKLRWVFVVAKSHVRRGAIPVQMLSIDRRENN